MFYGQCTDAEVFQSNGSPSAAMHRAVSAGASPSTSPAADRLTLALPFDRITLQQQQQALQLLNHTSELEYQELQRQWPQQEQEKDTQSLQQRALYLLQHIGYASPSEAPVPECNAADLEADIAKWSAAQHVEAALTAQQYYAVQEPELAQQQHAGFTAHAQHDNVHHYHAAAAMPHGIASYQSTGHYSSAAVSDPTDLQPRLRAIHADASQIQERGSMHSLISHRSPEQCSLQTHCSKASKVIATSAGVRTSVCASQLAAAFGSALWPDTPESRERSPFQRHEAHGSASITEAWCQSEHAS